MSNNTRKKLAKRKLGPELSTEGIILKDVPLSRIIRRSCFLSLFLPSGIVTYQKIIYVKKLMIRSREDERLYLLKMLYSQMSTLGMEPNLLTRTLALVIDLVLESITYISSKSKTNSGSANLLFL